MDTAAAGARPPVRTRGLWTGNFLVLFAVNAMSFGSLNLLLPTLPVHLAERGYGEGSVGILFGAFFVACVASRIVAAKASRRLGPVGAARAALAAAAAGNLLFLMPGGFPVHLAARLIYGAGFGLITTMLISMAARALPPARLAEGLGYLSLAATVALAAGPLAGLAIVGRWGFPALQAAVAGTLLAGLAATALLAPGAPPEGARGGRAAVSGGSAGSARAALPAASLSLLLGAANTAVFSYLALHLDQRGQAGAASFFAVATLGIAATRLVGGRLYDRHGHFWVVVPSAGLIEASLLIVFFAAGPATAPWAGLIFGLGMGALFPALQALAIGSVPSSGQTAASAAVLNGYDLGMFLNTVLMGQVAALMGGYRPVFGICAAFPALLWLVYGLNPAFRRSR